MSVTLATIAGRHSIADFTILGARQQRAAAHAAHAAHTPTATHAAAATPRLGGASCQPDFS